MEREKRGNHKRQGIQYVPYQSEKIFLLLTTIYRSLRSLPFLFSFFQWLSLRELRKNIMKLMGDFQMEIRKNFSSFFALSNVKVMEISEDGKLCSVC